MKKNKTYTAVALGFFDGVHLGHQSIIQETVKYENKNILPVVYTFKQSPKEIVDGKPYFYLTTNNEKIRLLSGLGIKKVYMDDFKNIKNLSCEEFIHKIIHKKLNAKYVICGENYFFGHNTEGNCEKLKEICQKYNIQTKIVPLKTYKGEYISSTRIKLLIKNQEFKSIQQMLGRKFDKK